MPNPKIYMTPESFVDMILAVQINPVEIGGLGKIVLKDNNFYVDEIIVPKQICSMGETEPDAGMIGDVINELMAAGKDAEVVKFRFWWHSHVHMRTIWSMTDEATIEDWRQNSMADWWVSVVLNIWGELAVRVDYFRPYRPTLHMHNLGFEKPVVLIDTSVDIDALYEKRWPRMSEIIDKNVTNRHSYRPVVTDRYLGGLR